MPATNSDQPWRISRATPAPPQRLPPPVPAPPQRLPTDSKARKATPMATGLLDYFPDALADVARLSKLGSDKHNPGQPMRWAREKSTDHSDCIMRHLVDRGCVDPEDGVLHDTKVAWRALALLQTEIERLKSLDIPYPPGPT